ncbi:MAG: 16S rRNA (cytosine(1402)-N(4))-methyltransferase RsmH [Syntrophomonadaceae bacterium]
MAHLPVLLGPTIDHLVTNPEGIYIDCTVGGGGHLAMLLTKLAPGSRVIALDKDRAVLERTRGRFETGRVDFVHADFRDLEATLGKLGMDAVDGILIDLGVSSFQLDEPERGFSYHEDARLDMRMNREQETSAWHLVNECPEGQLKKILWTYGEEKYAPAIARAIVQTRSKGEIHSTLELVEVIKNAVPARYRREKHPGRKTFQALRIAVNGELEALQAVLPQALAVLNKGGRLCIITFHSLEDRMVKLFFQEKARSCICPPHQPVCTCHHRAELQIITRKPVVPSEEECENNIRARSAKLRVASRL